MTRHSFPDATLLGPRGPQQHARMLLLTLGPWIAIALWLALTALPATRGAFLHWISVDRERNPVEVLTVLLLLLAAVFAGRAAARQMRGGARLAGLLLAGIAAGACLIAMEEISWGQHLLGFETPEGLRAVNVQNEFNLHNLDGIHGNAGKKYLVFVLLAVIASRPRMVLIADETWARLRAPAGLGSLTAAIFVTALPKLAIEHIGVPGEIRVSIRWLTELTELLIALWLAAYGWSVLHRARVCAQVQ